MCGTKSAQQESFVPPVSYQNQTFCTPQQWSRPYHRYEVPYERVYLHSSLQPDIFVDFQVYGGLQQMCVCFR